ncbi:hypothetical protein [Devosia riboflavina]|uniref:hypothetical protein n=1 Tax=Devosia riboflavina TaxID=46914 RepID=UPI001362AEC5|nr:hypothetical protein [Devosia riboflavina]
MAIDLSEDPDVALNTSDAIDDFVHAFMEPSTACALGLTFSGDVVAHLLEHLEQQLLVLFHDLLGSLPQAVGQVLVEEVAAPFGGVGCIQLDALKSQGDDRFLSDKERSVLGIDGAFAGLRFKRHLGRGSADAAAGINLSAAGQVRAATQDQGQ